MSGVSLFSTYVQEISTQVQVTRRFCIIEPHRTFPLRKFGGLLCSNDYIVLNIYIKNETLYQTENTVGPRLGLSAGRSVFLYRASKIERQTTVNTGL